VFEVDGDFCPWVAGRYELAAGPDGATCRTTTASADIRLHSRELAATYMGAVKFSTLVAAGRVQEESGGAIERADRIFHWPQAPWPLETF
jgi:predicted acetyltransferase